MGKSCRKLHPRSVGEQRRAVISTDFQPFRYRFLFSERKGEKKKRGEEKKEHTVEKGVIPKIWNKGGYRRSKIRSACVGKRFNFSNPLNFSHSSNTAFPRTGKRFHPTADHSGDPVGKKRNSEWKDAARQD